MDVRPTDVNTEFKIYYSFKKGEKEMFLYIFNFFFKYIYKY